MTSFMTVGCTESLIDAAIDEVKDRLDDNDDESTDILTLTKTVDGFSMTWDKNDTEFNEVMYRNTIDDAELLFW